MSASTGKADIRQRLPNNRDEYTPLVTKEFY